MQARQQHVPVGIFHSTPLFIESANGALINDVDGNTLIDFAGGIGTLNAGHANPKVVEAASEQSRRFTHTCFSVAPYESYVRLAQTLNRITPGAFNKKTMLVNSGAEGVENAVKIARHYTKREGVIVFEHAFHGRTLLTMSMTSKVKPYKLGFGPFAPEIYRLPYPYEYRNAPVDLEQFFGAHVAPENVSCVVIEPVLGEGGFVPAPGEYLRKIQQICRKYGILFIADEVQTGFGRTGAMFACEHYGLEPDLIVLAKSLAGGFPLSSVTGRAEIMDSSQVGGLGGTYSGNPVSCAAALAAIEFIERENLPARARAIGEIVRQFFNKFYERDKRIGDVRGLGAMMALEFVKDRKTKEPDKDLTNSIIKQCYENGLVLIAAG
ncbi:MAG TPA: 4-aminobutyrate--2-oxoglutarate transaminase, partial [Acidobacteriota bacterium]|nr:4-aminobutyrate--2-oxoglutarate transaminase [Acidobacteriota bacterium]